MIARAPILRASVAALVAIALAWLIGGQMLLGRIDPALVLPLLPLPMLLLAWLNRRDPAVLRLRTAALALLFLVILQAGLAYCFARTLPWTQLGLVALSGTMLVLIAEGIGRLRTGRAIRIAFSLLLVVGWFVGGHVVLASLYRPAAATTAPATILTGLPLRWLGGADISAMISEGTQDDLALARIEAAGPVRLVDSLIDHPPPPGGALLLAHPRALAPQELVAIDAFVRGGGRAVILADALSGWPAEHPLGDPRNPPVTSLLTPLLDHWGVELGAAEPRSVAAMVEESRLQLFSAGRFERLPPTCRSFADRRIAFCRIGQGRVWLVGDADLLFAPLWQPDPIWAAHLRKADTMEWLAARLWPGAPKAMLGPIWIRQR